MSYSLINGNIENIASLDFFGKEHVKHFSPLLLVRAVQCVDVQWPQSATERKAIAEVHYYTH